MKRSELFAALASSTLEGSEVTIDGMKGIVAAVERESGDGLSFNVLLQTNSVYVQLKYGAPQSLLKLWKFVRCTPE